MPEGPNPDPLATNIEAYLANHERKDVLRVIVCGSVDDGKSTLLGRLLYEAKGLTQDQLAALAADSKRFGTQGENLDFALLVDGLTAEREQGITIDVAYRFFTTTTRQFVLIDAPGHESFTSNMITGLSTADAALILVDASKGVLTQTRRHLYLATLLGVKHTVLLVNKMDLAAWSQDRFDAIVAELETFAETLGHRLTTAIPISALGGDNIVTPSPKAPWFKGPTLLAHLEASDAIPQAPHDQPLRMPVQAVNRPTPDFRGVTGLITAGRVRQGDTVLLSPSGRKTKIARIVTYEGDCPQAIAGQSVTLCFSDPEDCPRGHVVASPDQPPGVSDQFEATLIWMNQAPLLPGRTYAFKLATQSANAQITKIKHKVDINTLEKCAADTLALNDIAVCNLSLDQPIAFDPYKDGADMGGFILLDRVTKTTLAAGLIHFGLRRASNIQWQDFTVTRAARAAIKLQQPRVVWLTGLSGAGKSTIANLLDQRLHALGKHTVVLDGDNLRHGLSRDLGFSQADRVENVRRISEVAKLMADAGLIVIVALISPFRAERQMAREKMPAGEFIEVFVDAPIAEVEKRDTKGLYQKARAGLLKNVTGVDSPYEAPEAPDLRIDTTQTTPQDAARAIADLILGL
ncbi:MAG: adenylyl-sulfate kinase [Caulobacterales bacterium]